MTLRDSQALPTPMTPSNCFLSESNGKPSLCLGCTVSLCWDECAPEKGRQWDTPQRMVLRNKITPHQGQMYASPCPMDGQVWLWGEHPTRACVWVLHGIAERWWKFWVVKPSGRAMRHWRCILEGTQAVRFQAQDHTTCSNSQACSSCLPFALNPCRHQDFEPLKCELSFYNGAPFSS